MLKDLTSIKKPAAQMFERLFTSHTAKFRSKIHSIGFFQRAGGTDFVGAIDEVA
jgi:hypothetical protein